jgi:hypothetical protein
MVRARISGGNATPAWGWIALAGLLVASPAAAQGRPSFDGTGVYRAWQVLVLDSACRANAVALSATRLSCDGLKAFVANPLDVRPPAAAALNDAYRVVSQKPAAALDSIRTGMGLASSSGLGTFAPAGS